MDGRGSARRRSPRRIRADGAHGSLLGRTAPDDPRPGRLRGVCDVGRVPGVVLLVRFVYLAVLFTPTVHRSGRPRLRPSHACLVRRVAGVVAVVPSGLPRLPDPHLPGGVPGHLLLLSQGVLPLVLRDAPGLRRRSGPAWSLPGGDRAPGGPEPAPLRALFRHRVHLHPVRRRLPGLLPRRADRSRGGKRGPAREPDAPGGLYVWMPFLAPPRGGEARLLLLRTRRPRAPRDLAGRVGTQRPSHAVGLGESLLGRVLRPVRPPALDGAY